MTQTLDAVVGKIDCPRVVVTGTTYKGDERIYTKLPCIQLAKNFKVDDLVNPLPPLQFLDGTASPIMLRYQLPISEELLWQTKCNEIFTYGLFSKKSSEIGSEKEIITETGIILYAFAGKSDPFLPPVNTRFREVRSCEIGFTLKENRVSPLPTHCYLLLERELYEQVAKFCLEQPLQINPLFQKVTGLLLHPNYNGKIIGMHWNQLHQKEVEEDFIVSFDPIQARNRHRRELIERLNCVNT